MTNQSRYTCLQADLEVTLAEYHASHAADDTEGTGWTPTAHTDTYLDAVTGQSYREFDY